MNDTGSEEAGAASAATFTNTLWLGTGGNRDSPLFKDPEQLRRKFRAWMWPHDFEVTKQKDARKIKSFLSLISHEIT